jgi:hypothetical protein
VHFSPTVSKLAGQDPARHFLSELQEKHRFPVIFIDEKLYLDALAVFKQQERKRTRGLKSNGTKSYAKLTEQVRIFPD